VALRSLQSIHNPAIKRAHKLITRPEKYAPTRERLRGEILVEGPGPVSLSLESNARIISTLVTEEFIKDRRYEELMEKIFGLSIPVYLIDRKMMARISGTETPRGIISICRLTASTILDISPEDHEIVVVSDRIRDPGNTGTIIRVCDAAGISSFISLKGSSNPFTPKTIRSSAGSIFNLKIVFSEEEEFLDWCHRNSIDIMVTEPSAEKTIYDLDPRGRTALVFGNETEGISDKIRRACSTAMRIPIHGRAESLNVASAAAITVFEFVRKRTLQKNSQFTP
jgi:TrmH family RNA methyltransferase